MALSNIAEQSGRLLPLALLAELYRLAEQCDIIALLRIQQTRPAQHDDGQAGQ
jgi:hypothetical protein